MGIDFQFGKGCGWYVRALKASPATRHWVPGPNQYVSAAGTGQKIARSVGQNNPVPNLAQSTGNRTSNKRNKKKHVKGYAYSKSQQKLTD
jgi:hypothetical protein